MIGDAPLPDSRPLREKLSVPPGTESTSAALRRVEQERDEAVDLARRLRDQLGFADARIRELGAKRPTTHLDAIKAELASARTELDAVRTARDNLDRARSWIVARDGGRSCIRCDQEIRRGEAYELDPSTGDLIQHIHCPDQTEEHETA